MMKIVHGSQSKKEIFYELADKKLNAITELDKKVNLGDLLYRYKGKISNDDFSKYDNALDLIDEIRKGEISLSDAKNNQNTFKLYLGEIKKGAKKSKEQKNTIYNIESLYKARKEAIKFYDDYSYRSGKGLKIVTPKQMLQRLPIPLA